MTENLRAINAILLLSKYVLKKTKTIFFTYISKKFSQRQKKYTLTYFFISFFHKTGVKTNLSLKKHLRQNLRLCSKIQFCLK